MSGNSPQTVVATVEQTPRLASVQPENEARKTGTVADAGNGGSLTSQEPAPVSTSKWPRWLRQLFSPIPEPSVVELLARLQSPNGIYALEEEKLREQAKADRAEDGAKTAWRLAGGTFGLAFVDHMPLVIEPFLSPHEYAVASGVLFAASGLSALAAFFFRSISRTRSRNAKAVDVAIEAWKLSERKDDRK